MAGFIDVLLRGLMLVGAAVALGGVVFVLAVLRAGPGDQARCTRAARSASSRSARPPSRRPDRGGRRRARVARLPHDLGAAAAPFARTTFARASLARVCLGGATALLALSARAQGRRPRRMERLAAAAVLLVASSAMISHAMARIDHRALLMAVDVVHQLAVAVWVGGLIHLAVDARRARGHVRARARPGPAPPLLLDRVRSGRDAPRVRRRAFRRLRRGRARPCSRPRTASWC